MRNKNIFSIAMCTPILALVILLGSGDQLSAQEPGWYPYAVARGEARTMIRQAPVHMRPYRPLHFYGNTQRRVYYRGTPLPSLRDVRVTTRYTARRLVVPSRLLPR